MKRVSELFYEQYKYILLQDSYVVVSVRYIVIMGSNLELEVIHASILYVQELQKAITKEVVYNNFRKVINLHRFVTNCIIKIPDWGFNVRHTYYSGKLPRCMENYVL